MVVKTIEFHTKHTQVILFDVGRVGGKRMFPHKLTTSLSNDSQRKILRGVPKTYMSTLFRNFYKLTSLTLNITESYFRRVQIMLLAAGLVERELH